nr:cytochrome C nitrite reductase [Oleiagrimonas sp. C23AA]
MLGAQAAAPAHDARTIKHIDTISIPGNSLRSFDIGAVSEPSHTYGLSDRSNHAVDLFNTDTDRFMGRAKGFSGGPNGLVAVGKHQFWAGDGHSNLRGVNIASMKITSTIHTGGSQRVDELTYDPALHMVVAANNDDTPPFLTFVSTRGQTHTILGKLSLPQATAGLEQPAWNPVDGKIYVSIPELNHQKALGAVAIIDPRNRKLEGMIRLNRCMPAGLAMGPDDQALVGCSDDAVSAGFAPKSIIVDLKTRKIVSTLHQVGGSDEVWFDPGSKHYYLAAAANKGGPALGVVDATHARWLENLRSGAHAHSVAADSRNGRVFVPVAQNSASSDCASGCIKVFAPSTSH